MNPLRNADDSPSGSWSRRAPAAPRPWAERRTSYYERIALAEREWSANNLSRVEQLLDACPADLRGWEWRYFKRLRLGGVHSAGAEHACRRGSGLRHRLLNGDSQQQWRRADGFHSFGSRWRPRRLGAGR